MSEAERSAGKLLQRLAAVFVTIFGAVILAGCANTLPDAPKVAPASHRYLIGPGDGLKVFVWQNSDLSTEAIVRPDGMVSLPLIHDIRASGKTPTQLADDIQGRLKKYVNGPVVTVMVNSFVGLYSEQIRVVGEAAKPQAIPYRKGMTALDAMIAVGGLTQFADGDRATLIRTVRGVQTSFRLRLDGLLHDGIISDNVPLEPGDVITIPQTYL